MKKLLLLLLYVPLMFSCGENKEDNDTDNLQRELTKEESIDSGIQNNPQHDEIESGFIPDSVSVRHILFSDDRYDDTINYPYYEKEESREFLMVLKDSIEKGGCDFGEYAILFSDDRTTSIRGGDLGWFGRGVMEKSFEDACFYSDIKKGDLKIVESKLGVHLIQIIDYSNKENQTIRVHFSDKRHTYVDRKRYYDGNLFTGVFFNTYDNGQLDLEFNIKDGVQHGESKWYYKNGQLKSIENYKNGIVNGYLEGYYENGILSYRQNMVDGNKQGLRTEYYENGNKKKSFNFARGLLDGSQKYWHIDGTLRFDGNFKNGKHNNIIKVWYENGALKYKLEEDKLFQELDLNGNVISMIKNPQISVSSPDLLNPDLLPFEIELHELGVKFNPQWFYK